MQFYVAAVNDFLCRESVRSAPDGPFVTPIVAGAPLPRLPCGMASVPHGMNSNNRPFLA